MGVGEGGPAFVVSGPQGRKKGCPGPHTDTQTAPHTREQKGSQVNVRFRVGPHSQAGTLGRHGRGWDSPRGILGRGCPVGVNVLVT